MSALPVLPVVVPLAGAAIAALGRRSRLLQRIASVGSAVTVLVVGAVLLADPAIPVAALGGWPPEYAIVLVADPFASLLVTVTGGLVTAVVTSTMAGADDHHPFFHPLVLVLLAGVCGTFLTGDLFNLFVWFEVTLIASYVLAALDGTTKQVRAATVYVPTNLLGSLLVLVAVGLIYAASGSVNFAVLAQELPTAQSPVYVPAGLLLVAFGVKAALLPVGGWLPITYPAAPTAVASLFAGLLTTVGVAALYRVSLLIYDGSPGVLGVLLVVACVTAVVGALAATGQRDLAGTLAFVVVTQVGFMVAALALGTAAAIAAGVFFVVQDVIAKTAAYLAAASVDDPIGAQTPSRLTTARPVLAATFLAVALSLAGVPPMAGFVGKALVVDAAVATDRWAVVVVVLIASLLTALAAVGAWRSAFASVREQPAREPIGPSPIRVRLGRTSPPAVLAAVALLLGVLPGGLYTVARRAAEVLTDRALYIEAVLR